MREGKTGWTSTILGLAFAAVFLYLTFSGVDLTAIRMEIARLGWLDLLWLFLLSAAGLAFRGWRWLNLLPQPLLPGEGLAAQRANALGYGVNNVAPRVGEVVRIVALKRDTGRDAGEVASTAVADRVLFDFLFLAAMFAFALTVHRERVLSLFPRLEGAFYGFLAVTFAALAGLALAALRPAWLAMLLQRLGLPKWPFLWSRVSLLLKEVGAGLAVASKPRRLIALSTFNLLVWGVAVAYYALALNAFDLSFSFSLLLLLFTISTLGVIVPSPGGLGSMHYFVAVSLTQIAGVAEEKAAAIATVSHGVNYATLSLAALAFWFIKPNPELRQSRRQKRNQV